MMGRANRVLLAAAIIIAPVAVQAQRTEQSNVFTWSERIEAGHTVRAANVNGTVTVRQGTTDRVELTATKKWRRGDPARIHTEAKKVGDDVRICVLFDDQK